MTTYSESAQGLVITKWRALYEIQVNHGLHTERDLEDFLADLGDHETYEASRVLEWLGY